MTDLNSVAVRKTDAIAAINKITTPEKEYLKNINDFGIMICGSSKVGKSTLVNAICGSKVAATSHLMDRGSTETKKYSKQLFFEEGDKKVPATLSFYDTKGIENWDEDKVKKYVLSLLKETNPLAMFFCVSPGTMANTQCIKWFCDACHRSKIFFALVCTNKFAGNKDQRQAVINQFTTILETVAGRKSEINGEIFLCHKVGLVAAVNSEPFDDGRHEVDPIEGVNELCMAVMRELDTEKLKGWMLVCLDNRDLWTKFGHEIEAFFRDTLPRVANTLATVAAIFICRG